MSEEEPAAFDKLSDRGERHIQHDLARKRELEAALRRFHEQASAHPDLWKDSRAARDALRQAFELRALDHEINLLHLQQVRRPQVQGTLGKPASSQAPAAVLDPVRAQELRAFEAREALTEGEATRLVDREQSARLRWLLTILAEVQPETARELEGARARLRSEELAARGDRADSPPKPARPRRLQRREREMIDGLVRFLEPLLPT